jgi:AcrR family transcriptional regulator
MRTRVPRAEQVGRNRERVLDAAREVFLERGYAGASLDAIAERAGFSKGVVYSQFTNKADLFLALLDRRIDARAAENERAATKRHGVDALLALLRNFERDSRAEGGWARLLVEFRSVALRDPHLNERYAAAHRRTVERLADVVARVQQEAGATDGPPARTAAEFILAFGAGLTLERGADPRSLRSDVVLEMVQRAVVGRSS